MIRLLTLNLNYYVDKHGAWDGRCALLLETLREHRPEIVAFQAVRRDQARFAGLDQAAQLAQRAGYPYSYFQPADTEIGGLEAGSAFVAQLPIRQVDFLRLTNLSGIEDTNRRVLLSARFDTPAVALHVFNAHFSWVTDQLRNNVVEALPFMSAVQAPAILVGDLNAPAGQEDQLYLFEEAGWVDAWKALRPEDPGYTFEAGQPTIRIDYAWLNPFLANRLQDICIVADRPGLNGAHVSDHAGLLVTLDL